MTFIKLDATAGGIEMGQAMLKKLVIGGGLAGAIALYLYQIVQHNPKEAFGMLGQFGPSFIISLVVIVLFWNVLKMAVAQMEKLADGVQDLSIAVTKIAEKDDRRQEEMQRMAAFSAQQSERILVLLNDQGAQLKQISERLDRTG